MIHRKAKALPPNGCDALRRMAGSTMVVLALLSTLATPAAEAANHALIMTIGEYADPTANLPGIDVDARNAFAIAEAMAVPRGNMQVLSDRQLSVAGMRTAIAELGRKVGRGDNVFVYYSGHGTQIAGDPGKCSEGLLTHDLQVYSDRELEEALAELSTKAGQLVMMNDSCFSGGAATKALPLAGRRAKFFKLAAASGDYQCGQALNMKFAKNIVPTAAERGANLLYVAAASDSEVAFATSAGSAATVAWLGCLQATSGPGRDGAYRGAELRSCAQEWLDHQRFDQHIALEGNQELPLAYLAAGAAAKPALIDAGAVLQGIRSAASPTVRVALRVTKQRMKIGQDRLEFEVSTQQAGYLSVLHVGSDGKTFDLLFPNDIDANNHVAAGSTVHLPRPSWRVRAGGPAGTSRLLAVLSEKPRDFRKGLAKIGNTGFYGTPANSASAKNLFAEATGEASGDPGRYGASELVAIEEY